MSLIIARKKFKITSLYWFISTQNRPAKSLKQNKIRISLWPVTFFFKVEFFLRSGTYGNKILSNERTYTELVIDTKDFVDVVPVDIVNPSHFCCHIVGNAADFKLMTNELNTYYASTKAENVQWKKMMPCVACYDGKWKFLFRNSFRRCDSEISIAVNAKWVHFKGLVHFSRK